MHQIKKVYYKIVEEIDLPFLIFLITISSNKIYLKVVALGLIFTLKPKFDLIFKKNIPSFYPLIIIFSIFQFLFFGGDFSLNHILVFCVGIFYWFLCYAFMYQAYLFVSNNTISKINKTLIAFLYLNFLTCIINYLKVCHEAQTLLPFLQYSGDYGASTGDYICGLFGVPSYINAMVCCILAIYFLEINKLSLFILSTFTAFLSFANIINLIFIGVLVIYFCFKNENKKKVFIAINIVICFLMYVYISPDNYNYLKKTIGLSVYNQKEIMPEVVISDSRNKNKMPQHVKYKNDSSASIQKIEMLDRNRFFGRDYFEYKTFYPVNIKSNPGKKIALLQTMNFLINNPLELFFGAGQGSFSSRLAFQFSGRDSSRLFSKMPKYCNGNYFKNNLLIYDSMIQLPIEYHSIKHFPNNFLSQIFGEYGLIGFILFIYYYIYFYYKRLSNKFFFVSFFLLISSFLMLDYLFEFFNVMLLTETVLFIFIKEKNESKEIT